MAAPQISLSELRPGRCVRIVLLLIPNILIFQSFLIQASVSMNRLNTFRELLREGAMYELSGFDVNRSDNHFKLCDSVVSIQLNNCKFRSLEQLIALANTNIQLPDIEVSDIRTTYNDHTQTTQRVMVNIKVDNNATVCVSVFDSVAEQLHKRLEASVVQPKVMVATNINP
ncbi:hypothetical protein Bca52824_024115 [Brassica carinata]|uniref:Replication factor A C-terminal domain-containing protein n=1 Tax=Brassica carinata TaxID=52824 RepID=A0A8X7VIZ6_BRACI|nr:hypothetical protein Bca52824_024115 [Brassica carinata]